MYINDNPDDDYVFDSHAKYYIILTNPSGLSLPMLMLWATWKSTSIQSIQCMALILLLTFPPSTPRCQFLQTNFRTPQMQAFNQISLFINDSSKPNLSPQKKLLPVLTITNTITTTISSPLPQVSATRVRFLKPL